MHCLLWPQQCGADVCVVLGLAGAMSCVVLHMLAGGAAVGCRAFTQHLQQQPTHFCMRTETSMSVLPLLSYPVAAWLTHAASSRRACCNMWCMLAASRPLLLHATCSRHTCAAHLWKTQHCMCVCVTSCSLSSYVSCCVVGGASRRPLGLCGPDHSRKTMVRFLLSRQIDLLLLQ